MSSSDRDKFRQALNAGPITNPGPFLCYLTIDGLHRTDPGNLIALRGRNHAVRTAAEGQATIYHNLSTTRDLAVYATRRTATRSRRLTPRLPACALYYRL